MQITFSIEYNTRWGESLCLVAQDVKYPMQWAGDGIWTVTLKNTTAAILKDYTYVVMEDGLVTRTEWEHHSSRRAGTILDKWKECPIGGCPFPRRHSAELFDRPGFRGAGTAVPVFSLRTASDFGNGSRLCERSNGHPEDSFPEDERNGK